MNNRPGLVTGAIRYLGQLLGKRPVSQTADSFNGSNQVAYIGLPDKPEASYVWLKEGQDGYEVVGYYNKTNHTNEEV